MLIFFAEPLPYPYAYCHPFPHAALHPFPRPHPYDDVDNFPPAFRFLFLRPHAFEDGDDVFPDAAPPPVIQPHPYIFACGDHACIPALCLAAPCPESFAGVIKCSQIVAETTLPQGASFSKYTESF